MGRKASRRPRPRRPSLRPCATRTPTRHPCAAATLRRRADPAPRPTLPFPTESQSIPISARAGRDSEAGLQGQSGPARSRAGPPDAGREPDPRAWGVGGPEVPDSERVGGTDPGITKQSGSVLQAGRSRVGCCRGGGRGRLRDSRRGRRAHREGLPRRLRRTGPAAVGPGDSDGHCALDGLARRLDWPNRVRADPNSGR